MSRHENRGRTTVAGTPFPSPVVTVRAVLSVPPPCSSPTFHSSFHSLPHSPSFLCVLVVNFVIKRVNECANASEGNERTKETTGRRQRKVRR